MRLRRGPKLKFGVLIGQLPRLCPNGNCALPVSVLDEKGNPAPGVLVSAFKNGIRLPEVFENVYTDAKGNVALPFSPRTGGSVSISVRDLSGNGESQTFVVQ